MNQPVDNFLNPKDSFDLKQNFATIEKSYFYAQANISTKEIKKTKKTRL